MHQLYTSLGINTNDVIDAASTKWNFMELTPGMVGGHCISIDPYYLMHKSAMSGFSPTIMSAARKVNDCMHEWVLSDFLDFININEIDLKSKKITILGYTFKENCSDTRNTKVKDLILAMLKNGFQLNLWDPMILEQDHLALNNIGVETFKKEPVKIDIAIVCVYHNEINSFLKNYDGILYDYRYKIYSKH